MSDDQPFTLFNGEYFKRLLSVERAREAALYARGKTNFPASVHDSIGRAVEALYRRGNDGWLNVVGTKTFTPKQPLQLDLSKYKAVDLADADTREQIGKIAAHHFHERGIETMRMDAALVEGADKTIAITPVIASATFAALKHASEITPTPIGSGSKSTRGA